MFTSAPRCSPRWTIVGLGRVLLELDVDVDDLGRPSPPVSWTSNALSRPMMMPGSPTYSTSTMAESCRIGRSATSLPSCALTAVTSMVTPAFSRAVRPAPISKPSSPPPNSA